MGRQRRQRLENDYFMISDANLGAFKSDYYVKRALDYTVDFTGERPLLDSRFLIIIQQRKRLDDTRLPYLFKSIRTGRILVYRGHGF